MNPNYDRARMVVIGQQPGAEGRANKYHPEACDFIKELAQEGCFPEEWCAALGVHKDTFYNWANEHPEFEEAARQAFAILEAFWAAFVRANLRNPDLKTAPLGLLLTKRFPHIWGKDPKGTFDHFTQRNVEVPVQADGVEAGKPQNRAQLMERIEVLQKRLKDRSDP